MTPPTSAKDILDDAGGGDFLNADERQSMYERRAAFYVTGAVPFVEGQWDKPQVYFYVVRQGSTGEKEQRTLALSHSVHRQRVAEAIERKRAEGAQVTGPWYLDKVPTQKGSDAWAMVDKPPVSVDSPQAANPNPSAQEPIPVPGPPQTPMASAAVYDDLPF